jgi:predicted GTPase
VAFELLSAVAIMTKTRIVILGAAGRDFHDFNVAYRDDPAGPRYS